MTAVGLFLAGVIVGAAGLAYRLACVEDTPAFRADVEARRTR